ncbi:exodeoxyribonuclease III [Leptospira congkakensis]|uniref:Exodeoxyribonuclease III n=1 Tax=Leptospira congkakensis TaxID=2484932 RepID=A0A4Z1ACW3_9LEPT|nr:exodeoxyribonuclease III [Leptospira congkakensis]TGL90403.1 exodeoxyribonuclease III [Leptospira congkakensis]TGL91410.1 exodeoxyribonuclease III [Leptospira congkakensis]TGL98463.1 exodeoxyribonuclease III [Leptospira congkakensis]
MKIITLNCNGIRSSLSKGLLEFIRHENPDIICFQETKAPIAEIDREEFRNLGYSVHTCIADKPGYSGTAILTKPKPKSVAVGFGDGIYLSEGRSLLAEYPDFFLWNLYFPSGTSGEERQKVKYQFLDSFFEQALPYTKKKKPLIVCGDVNIAHTDLDIHNPKGNQKSSGFLPEERAWVSKLLDSGFLDCYRVVQPETKDDYSWWTYRFQARKNNKGWRIDYFFITKSPKYKIESVSIAKEPVLSDHAPVVMKIQFT